jgi:hypothetical protein
VTKNPLILQKRGSLSYSIATTILNNTNKNSESKNLKKPYKVGISNDFVSKNNV